MIPTGRLLALLAVPTALSIAYALVEGVLPVVLALDAVIVVVALVDLAANRGEVEASRTHGAVQSVGLPFDVLLQVRNPGTRALAVRVHDDVDGERAGLPASAVLPAGEAVEVGYQLTLPTRGRWDFGQISVRWSSPLGLWERQVRIDTVDDHVRVYPDFTHLRRYGLKAREDELRLPVRARRKPGGENEFQRLRPYVPGDPYRHIDWKATARKRQFVTREFGQESNQNVIFLLDAGRMMTARLGDLTGFDHALNASLAMAHVALRHGDRVGLLAFDRQVRTWLPPRGGARSGSRLIQGTYDLFPTTEDPDYGMALRYLASRVRRRSLIVLMTAMTDEVNAQAATAVLGALHKRHVPVVVWLRDPDLDDMVDAPVADEAEMYQRCAAAELVGWREKALDDLRRRGVLVVDASPEALTTDLLGRYLEVKARRLL